MYTGPGKNIMLEGLRTVATHAGLLEPGTPIENVVGEADDEKLTKVGHGLNNGDLVVLRNLVGGAGLEEETPYYVVGVDGNDFQLSMQSGGTAINFTTDITDVDVVELTEVTGGSPAYARKALTVGAAGYGTMAVGAAFPVFDVPAGAEIEYVGTFSALTAGTLYDVSKVTKEDFAGQGTYTVSAGSYNLNRICA